MDKIKIIAFYLPQFHPIPENDEWWGKGFTEWTNVGKAKPLFKGHYQPKVPADLGYYDLRLSESREEQARLAKEAGVYGFCYWHYWFGDGKQLLERPFREVLDSGHPDFPFCLGWANESWQAKEWNAEKQSIVKKTLIEQKYLGVEDNEQHFNAFLKAFKDSRYIKIDGRPLFFIYRPLQFDGISRFLKEWNDLLKKKQLAESFYFVGQANNEEEIGDIENLGFDAITISQTPRMSAAYQDFPLIKRVLIKLKRKFFNTPIVVDYKDMLNYLWNPSVEMKENIIPSILPNWDHSPRSGKNCIVLHNSNPKLFKKHCKDVLHGVSQKENKLVFLKSWNEWGEGNYMEPDIRYGKQYIKALSEVMLSVE